MIRKLHIQNYRCLRDVRLDLEPLTVFVGANGSGKSSAFSALAHNIFENDRWQRSEEHAVRVVAWSDDGVAHERHLRSGRGAGGIGIDSSFPRCQVLQLGLQQLRQPNQLQEVRQLGAEGLGLANLFATVPRRSRETIASQYCSLVPMFADVDLRPTGNGHHSIVFQDKWSTPTWYLPAEVSDGSMLLLAFLLLPYQSPPPDIIAIEEPERGLHPYLMDQLVRLLRKLSKGEVGPRPVQVLLATHSAQLLEFVDATEVRFFSRSKDTGETRVEAAPVNDSSWAKTMQVYDGSLGDVWLSGGLGGVPRS